MGHGIDLPPDLLRLVFSRLHCLRDKAAAASVCSGWAHELAAADELLWRDVALSLTPMPRSVVDPAGRHASQRFFSRRGAAVRTLALSSRRIPPASMRPHPRPPTALSDFLRSNASVLCRLLRLSISCQLPTSALPTVAQLHSLQSLTVGTLVWEAEARLYSVLVEDARGCTITHVLQPLSALQGLQRLEINAYHTADGCILVTSCGPPPSWLPTLPHLRHLSLPNVSALPAHALPLARLEALSLLDANMDTFPQAVTGCAALTQLTVELSVVLEPVEAAVPRQLAALDRLRALQLTHVPWLREAGRLTALHALSLHDCGLYAWPDWLRGLTALTRLSLRHNALAHVPRALSALHALAELDVACNGSRLTLPSAVAALSGTLTRLVWGAGLCAEDMSVFLESSPGPCLRLQHGPPPRGTLSLMRGAILSELPLCALGECYDAVALLQKVAEEYVPGEGAAVMVV